MALHYDSRASWNSREPFITVEGLIIRYSPGLSPVLHGVLFEFKAEEKVGLLGRTRSSKSMLVMSFLRFTGPPAGRITTDGVGICETGLGDLCSKLVSICPRFEYLPHLYR